MCDFHSVRACVKKPRELTVWAMWVESTSHLCFKAPEGDWGCLAGEKRKTESKCMLTCPKSTLGIHCECVCVRMCACHNSYGYDSWAQVWQQEQRPVQQVSGFMFKQPAETSSAHQQRLCGHSWRDITHEDSCFEKIHTHLWSIKLISLIFSYIYQE